MAGRINADVVVVVIHIIIIIFLKPTSAKPQAEKLG